VSTTFVLSLALAVALLLGARLLLPALPLRGGAITLGLAEFGALAAGLAVLAFHCVAMFFTSLAARLPASASAIDDIRALGTASVVWYVAPVLVVLLALRRLQWGPLTVVFLALLSIGVTMYDGGTLERHLLTIWGGVTLLAATILLWVRPPATRSAAVPA
jgi:hypothetical protein